MILMLALAFAGAAKAQEPNRVALVIGNSAYQHVPPLTNARRDAQSVAAALKAQGFAVDTLLEADAVQMRQALLAFSLRAQGAEAATIYFAGHGLEQDGRQHLLPVDVDLRPTFDLSLRRAPTLEDFTRAVASASRLRLVMLDASRDSTSLQGGGAVTRGLARSADAATEKTHVVFSTAAGALALEGPPGGLSPFAEALTQVLREPPIQLHLLIPQLGQRVARATNSRQTPELQGPPFESSLYLHRTTAAERSGSESVSNSVSGVILHDMRPDDPSLHQHGLWVGAFNPLQNLLGGAGGSQEFLGHTGRSLFVPLEPPALGLTVADVTNVVGPADLHAPPLASGPPLLRAAAPRQTRVALVVGNDSDSPPGAAYLALRNEALIMTVLLQALAFDDVELLYNPDQGRMTEALSHFAQKAASADLALLFYSGEALPFGGELYLFPNGAPPPASEAIPALGLSLREALSALHGARRLRLAFLDFSRRSLPPPGFQGQPPALPPPSLPFDRTLISFALDPAPAQDERGRSPYAQALMESLWRNPQIDLRQTLSSLGPRMQQLAGAPQNPGLVQSPDFHPDEHLSISVLRP